MDTNGPPVTSAVITLHQGTACTGAAADDEGVIAMLTRSFADSNRVRDDLDSVAHSLRLALFRQAPH